MLPTHLLIGLGLGAVFFGWPRFLMLTLLIGGVAWTVGLAAVSDARGSGFEQAAGLLATGVLSVTNLGLGAVVGRYLATRRGPKPMSPQGFVGLAVLTTLVTAALASCSRDVYTPEAGDTSQTPLPQTTVTTVPPVESALELSVVLTPGSSPHIRSVVIRSRSDLPVDLSGWLLESPGFESQGVVLPFGTVITSSVSFGVYQIRARECPSAVAAMYLCYSPFSDEDPALHSSGIVLKDVDGVEIASWSQWG